jgi:hypothetical protein
VLPALNFVKMCLPKKIKWCPKNKAKVNVLNLSDYVKFLDCLLKGSMTLHQVGQYWEK